MEGPACSTAEDAKVSIRRTFDGLHQRSNSGKIRSSLL